MARKAWHAGPALFNVIGRSCQYYGRFRLPHRTDSTPFAHRRKRRADQYSNGKSLCQGGFLDFPWL